MDYAKSYKWVKGYSCPCGERRSMARRRRSEMVCEKCWADAALLARSEGTSQTEAYYKILARHNHDSTARIRELEAALAAAQERNTALQSEHLDHVIRLYDQLTAANSEIEKLSALLGKDNKNGN